MALLLRGTPCPLCGKPILEVEQSVMFPPFVANEADPLWRFSDGAFHADCFYRESLALAAERRLAEVREASARRACYVCGEQITEPDDYVPFGNLTDDQNHPLHRFNYACFHRLCLRQWEERATAYKLALDELRSGAWKGRGMRYLVEVLETP